MVDHGYWVQDVDALRSLGARDMRAVADDLAAASEKVGDLSIVASAFGEEEIAQQVRQKYEELRAALRARVGATGRQVDKVADAVVGIADNYKNVEEKMS